EGNLVREGWESFVGQYPIPNRHGMTVGELAKLFREHFGIQCDLTIVPMKGWQRSMWYDETGLTWVAPSPNMPTLSTATVYPGMCLVEGTHLSEGRGTTLPFELCGAPYIDPRQLVEQLQKENLPGVFARPCFFKPGFQKWAGETCGGIQLHVTDREKFKPFLTGLAVLRAIARLYPDRFAWRTEPYEFVSDRLAIDLLYGNPDWREKLVGGQPSLLAIEETWHDELETFKKIRQQFLLY
ncbi:MAG: exo-beta-N-acetylmuramidase NamZ domain-containing protein, partial [Nitrospinales bacterium]